MASQGPKSASAGANDASYGTVAWTQEGDIVSHNGAYAACSFSSVADSNYLKATNFGFTIPSGATIDGIVVEVEKYDFSNSGLVDARVRIVKGGTVGSTDLSSGATWPFVPAYVTHGSSSNLWGDTWTHSDVNASNFGVVLSVHSPITSALALVDHVRITVYYTASSAGQPAAKRMGGVQFAHTMVGSLSQAGRHW